MFTKFCDSVLSKTSKVRGLVTDLTKHYKNCPTAQKYHYVNSTFLFSLSTFNDPRVKYISISSCQSRSSSGCHLLRSVQALKKDLDGLDAQYNKLSECLAKGESEEFSPEFLSGIWGYHNKPTCCEQVCMYNVQSSKKRPNLMGI